MRTLQVFGNSPKVKFCFKGVYKSSQVVYYYLMELLLVPIVLLGAPILVIEFFGS